MLCCAADRMHTSVNDLSAYAAYDASSTTSSNRLVPKLLSDITLEGALRVTPTALEAGAHSSRSRDHVGAKACRHACHTQHGRYLMMIISLMRLGPAWGGSTSRIPVVQHQEAATVIMLYSQGSSTLQAH